MKRLIFLTMALLFAKSAQSQDDFPKYKIVGIDTIYTIVDVQARPVEGMANFYKEIASIMKYPDFARRKKIEGRVFLEFIVNQDGTLSDIGVIRGVEKSLDEESLRVLKNVKNWIPGKVAGKTVKSKFNIAIIFKLS